jgi:chromosome segregation ATPase
MKASVAAVVLVCTLPCAAWPQSPAAPASEIPAAPAAAPASQPEVEQGDRFAGLWDESERLRLVYEKTHNDNIAQVDRLLKTRVCQDKRVSGLIDRTLDAMNAYLSAAKRYFEVWGNAEEKRVEEQQKVLANMVVDQERVAGILDEEKKNRETLDRKEADLEQSKRTEEIRKDIDELKKDIIDSQDRLNKAQQTFDSLTVQITNMKTSIAARLIGIRQNSARLDAFGLEQTSVYEDKRKAAHEVCNTKQPGTLRTPLPKPAANP